MKLNCKLGLVLQAFWLLSVEKSFAEDAYVLNKNDNTVSIINATTQAVTDTVTVGTTPQFIAFTPDGTQAYITNSSRNTVSVINTTTLDVTTIPVQAAPETDANGSRYVLI